VEDILNGEFEFLVTNYGIAEVARFDLHGSAWGSGKACLNSCLHLRSAPKNSDPTRTAAVSQSERHRAVSFPS
jgi:hypothetical protein